LRKSKLETAQTREMIVAAASDLIRSGGIAETSLANVMAVVGLTHGGFYKHFRDKEQMIAEAVLAAGEKTLTTVGRNMGKGGRNAAVDSYLSKSHRDNPVPVCAFAAAGSEMARAGKETKGAAAEVMEKLFTTLAGDSSEGPEARGEAIVVLATMVGAMTLARMVADSKLSSEILDRAKEHLHR
jgi:TetR/AcrR family transcriptional regulator, transcriptional repressor for nem operon